MSGQFQLALHDLSSGKYKAVRFDTDPVGFKEICAGPLLQEIMRQLIYRLAQSYEPKIGHDAELVEYERQNERIDARLKEWGAK